MLHWLDYLLVRLVKQERFDYITSAFKDNHAIIAHFIVLTHNFKCADVLVGDTASNLLQYSWLHLFEEVPAFKHIHDGLNFLRRPLCLLNQGCDRLDKITQPLFLLYRLPFIYFKISE